MKKFNIETELSEFNLDRMNPSGKDNLIKVARLLGPLTREKWTAFISNYALDLQAIAKESGIARSSLYQNDSIKRYVLSKAELLHNQGVISELPYQTRNKLHNSGKTLPIKSHPDSDNVIQEKIKEIKVLKSQLEGLTTAIAELKSELKIAEHSVEQNDIRAIHLAQFGRYLR